MGKQKTSSFEAKLTIEFEDVRNVERAVQTVRSAMQVAIGITDCQETRSLTDVQGNIITVRGALEPIRFLGQLLEQTMHTAARIEKVIEKS